MDVFTVLRWVVHHLIVFMNVPIEDGDGFRMLRCAGVAAVETLFDVVAFKKVIQTFWLLRFAHFDQPRPAPSPALIAEEQCGCSRLGPAKAMRRRNHIMRVRTTNVVKTFTVHSHVDTHPHFSYTPPTEETQSRQRSEYESKNQD
jgi:hypothetical protein